MINELIQTIAILYVTSTVSYFLYWLGIRRIAFLVKKIVKGTKSRKDLAALTDDAILNMKLSPIWPIALCRILIKRFKKQ